MTQDSNFEFAHIERVQTLFDLNRPAEALQESVKGLAHYPESYYLHYFKALSHLNMDDISEAEASIRTAINLDLNNGDGYYLRSIILSKQLNFSGELDMAKRAAQLDPENEDYLGRLVEALLQSGELGNARDVANQLVKLDPTSAESHEQLARICVELKDWAGAEKSIRAALAILPMQLHLHQYLATILSAQQRFEEAVEVLFTAVKQEPTNEALLNQLDASIRDYLPSPLRKSAHARAVAELPAAIEAFYRDRHGRRSFYENNSMLIHGLVWCGGLAFLAVLAKLFGLE